MHAGVTVDGKDKYGNTALHLAAQHGSIALCVLLLRWGGNGWLTDATGASAAMMAQSAGHVECANVIEKWLTEHQGSSRSANADPDPDPDPDPNPDIFETADASNVVTHLSLYGSIADMHAREGSPVGGVQVLIPNDAVLFSADKGTFPHPGAGK